MDPDTNLERQRALVKQIISGDVSPDEAEYRVVAEELAEPVDAMDTWLTGGGFFPTSWSRKRGK